MSVNWTHVAAVLVMGAGGLYGLHLGYSEAAFVLFGMIGGYVFRNGRNSFRIRT